MASPCILVSFPFDEGSGWHIPLGVACVSALRELGFRVETFNPVVAYKSGQGWKALERAAVLACRAIGRPKSWTKARLPWLEESIRYRAFIETVARAKPDYVLVISTFTYPAWLLERVRVEFGVKQLIGWCVEGPTWLGDPNAEADLYDHYFCIHKAGIRNSAVRYLPALGYDPDTYRKFSGVKKAHDLVFVGRQKPRRVEWLRAMNDLALDIYGPGWEKTELRAHIRGPHIDGESLNLLYNRSRVALNVSAWPNHDFNCLNLRILDVPATGSLLISDFAPDIAEYFEPGKEVVVANSPEEMRELAHFYLKHESERERVALAGYERAITTETYFQKMRRMLEAAGIPLPTG